MALATVSPAIAHGADVPVAAPRRGTLTRGRVRFLAASDLLGMAGAMALSYWIADLMASPSIVAEPLTAAALLTAGWLAWIAVFAAYGLYERATRTIVPTSLDELGLLFHALLCGNLAFLLVAQVLVRLADIKIYTPVESVLLLACAMVLVPAGRVAVRAWVLPRTLKPRRTLIVGAGKEAVRLAHKLAVHTEYGLDLVGLVDTMPGRNVVGRPEDLTRLVDELEIDWVILATSGRTPERTLDAIRGVRRPDVHLSILPSYGELFASNALVEDLEGMPVVTLPSMRLSRTVTAVKRAVDIVGAGLGLLILSPLLAAIAVAIKLDSPGPVFFRQARRGRRGSTFRIVKFRTMCDRAEEQRFELARLNQVDGPLFKIHADPRITRVGSVLRRYSLDELPQLWNVLRGEMSLVGPRPFVLHEASQITGWAERRLDITPGVTGLWQVSGRNDLPFEEMVRLDYVYVTNWSLWWDIKILLRTIPVVLARRGAY